MGSPELDRRLLFRDSVRLILQTCVFWAPDGSCLLGIHVTIPDSSYSELGIMSSRQQKRDGNG